MSLDAIDLLLRTDLLGGVPEDRLRDLDPPPEWLSILSGETLIEQGLRGEAFYLLVHGRLRVFVTDADGVTRRVGEVLPGEGVGEMSLLTNELTAATVRAMHDCELVRFSHESYKQLMETSPEAALQVTRTVIKRLRSGMAGRRRGLSYKTIAVLPIDEHIDKARFANLLQNHLSDFVPVSTLNSERLGSHHSHLLRGTDRLTPEVNREITSKLLVIEAENTITVYPCDYEPTEWTRLCLRQADLVLLVSTVESDPSLTNAEESLINHLEEDLAPRSDLILLHPDEWRPHCGAARWIGPRKVAETHHVRAWSESDFARLARIITGNAINLVLGGGGARGFAQIGVLRALTEAGVPVDRIGGTSMGSIIGAQFALGQTIDEITQVSREIWVEGKPLSDYTFPAMAIVRGRRLHNLVRHALEGWDVEDLPIGFFCVSGNLTTADLMLHDRGTLWEGVRASGSIPGAGPPMFWRGNILVDGGVLNNLPGDLVLARYGGALISVDVSPQEPMAVPENFDEVPSGWRILWSKINPFEVPFPLPSIFEILVRTATLSSARLAKQTHKLTDLLLVPPIERYGTLAFDDMEEIVDAGYRYTVARLHGEVDQRIAHYIDKDRLPALEDLSITPADQPEKEKAERSARRRRRRAVVMATVLFAALIGSWNFINGGHLPTETNSVAKSVTPRVVLETVVEHEGANILPVETIVIRHSDGYEITGSYAGRVVSRRESDLGFERTGTVVEVSVDEGDQVKHQQVLSRLDVRTLVARRAELQAELALSRAKREQTEARLNLALATTKRRAALLERSNVSRQSYDEAKFDAEALRSELAANTAEIKRVGALLHSLQVDIEKSSIRAPFGGTIVERLVDEGTAVTAGIPVLRLIENGVKEVRAGVPAQAASELEAGAEYSISINGEPYRARLKALLAMLNAESRTVPVTFEIEDKERRLRSGQLAQLHLRNKIAVKGFWLPLTAITGGRRGLWNAYALVESDEPGLMRTSRRELQMLYSDSERAYVRGTLKDAELVVKGGLHRLVPGQLVKAKHEAN